MVAIEHRQTSAIIASDTAIATTAETTSTPTLTAISSPSSRDSLTPTNIETLAATATATTASRRSSDIVNSNDIAALSPTSLESSVTNSSSTITIITSTEIPTATTTTDHATANIIFVTPKEDDTKDNNIVEEEKVEKFDYSLSPKSDKSSTKMSQSSSEASTATASASESAAVVTKKAQAKQQIEPASASKCSAVSQRNVDIQIAKVSNKDAATKELSKKMLKLDLAAKELDEYSIKSPKSPIATRLPHQSSLSAVEVEDRKTLREALYQGIFHRHRRTIFAVGSFLRMLRSRNSSYNTIRSSSEGEDVDETR